MGRRLLLPLILLLLGFALGYLVGLALSGMGLDLPAAGSLTLGLLGALLGGQVGGLWQSPSTG